MTLLVDLVANVLGNLLSSPISAGLKQLSRRVIQSAFRPCLEMPGHPPASATPQASRSRIRLQLEIRVGELSTWRN